MTGRMVKHRARIMGTGVTTLDFEESAKTFKARVVGNEEAVSCSVFLIVELADGCGVDPGYHTIDN